MIEWSPFTYQRKTYDLSHLHPFQMTVVQSATNDKEERQYQVQVFFSLHCFTANKEGKELIDTNLLYKDSRETRIFDFDRYELSKNLKDIILEVGKKKCFHTGRDNFFIIEMINKENKTIQYEIYFTLSKSKQILNLFIQSAYPRDRQHWSGHKNKKPVRFMILAHNTLVGKKTKMPK